MNSALSSASANNDLSSSFSGAYCALTSTSGIFGTSTHPSSPSVEEIRDDEGDSRNYHIVQVAQRVPRVRVARAERPTGAAEREAEHRDPDGGERQEAPEGHAEDPGGDGDERAQDRQREAERHEPKPVALEAPLGAVELRLVDVQEPPVAQDQRPSAEVADPPADRGTQRVPEDAGDDQRDVRAGAGHAEDLRVAADRARGDRARVEHRQLARSGDHRR